MRTHVNFKRVSKIDGGNAWEFVRKGNSSLAAFMHFLFCIHARKFYVHAHVKTQLKPTLKVDFYCCVNFRWVRVYEEMKSSSMFLLRAI